MSDAKGSPLSAYMVGADTLLQQCAERWLERGHRLLGLFTDSPALARWAEAHGVPVAPAPEAPAPETSSSETSSSETPSPGAAAAGAAARMAAALRDEPADYLFAITHLRLLPDSMLALPKLGAINFHDGPLPRYAGLNAPAWALRAGERTHGVTWHWITAGVDRGDVLEQAEVAVDEDDTAFTLNARCFEAGMASFATLVDSLERGRPAGVPQDLDQRTVFGRDRRPPRACVVDLAAPVRDVLAQVRSLDFGDGYANPLGVAKLWTGADWVGVGAAVAVDGPVPQAAGAAGTVLRADDAGLTVACADGAVRLNEFRTSQGAALPAADAARRFSWSPGTVLPALPAELAAALDDRSRRWAKGEPRWVASWGAAEPLILVDSPAAAEPAAPLRAQTPLRVPAGSGASAGDRALAVALLFLTRRAGRAGLVGLRTSALARELTQDLGGDPAGVPAGDSTGGSTGDRDRDSELGGPGLGAFYVSHPPFSVPRPDRPAAEAIAATAEAVADHAARGSLLWDLCHRHRLGNGRLPICAHRVDAVQGEPPLPADCSLALWVADDGEAVHWAADAAVFDQRALDDLAAQCAAFAAAVAASPEASIAAAPMLDDEALARVLGAWNDTHRDYDRAATVHGLIRARAASHPDDTAAVHRGVTWTYAELDRRTDQLAAALRERGAAPGQRVGLCTSRGLAMLEGMLGILKSGAAYVPLDPSYPVDRLAYMVADAGIGLLVVDEVAARQRPDLAGGDGMDVVCLTGDRPRLAALAPDAAEHATADDLAYVIYTSGSTGRPKGVMVQHRNAVNFFEGMDERVGAEPGTWAAVTSPSFDISVLELLWTLSRGFEVVLADGVDGPSGGEARRSCGFSLFYFASDEGGAEGADKYRLLLDGARFADSHGFEAVWMPERHFHAFGGLYPNPSVAAAAVASITERVGIRSGSVVMPLHHPIRVAEEWSLVDNLSQGRVGISFAAGWQPNDFVIMPANFEDRKALMYQGIRQVQALWRGEEQTFPGPKGDVTVRTLPRPVQRELPTWVTIAGNPDTFREAGEIGANVLTHLLGQTTAELGEKLALYRKAWDEAGHPGRGHVTLMLHTFVGPDPDMVRETVRGPMKNYLGSAVDLVKKAAWSFPTFKARDVDPGQMMERGLSDEDMDALLEHAFERYYETSGLFGTPEQVTAFVQNVLALGVDEMACLVDFGVPTDLALKHLPYLDSVRQQFAANDVEKPGPLDRAADHAVDDAVDHSLPALIERHGVTHLQCTPSMASMLVQDPAGRAALGRVQTMMVGGEALPTALARDLVAATGGRVLNMYGPTETTIWSAVWEVTDPDRIAIGTPIANTQLYVLDDRQQPVPQGVPGELCIGGEGVVPGYLDRPELTAERFVADRFAAPRDGEAPRIYRTGDLVRWRDDGVMEFLGRLDHQVKVRGYRIELGEIEAALTDHESIQQSVVMAREDSPGDVRLVAYAVAVAGVSPDEAQLKAWLKERLPEFMVPAHVVFLREFPQTPNRKVDRKALPAPTASGVRRAPPVAAADDREAALQSLWEEALGVTVGVEDNFFDLGGHSLLAVRVQRMIQDRLGLEVSLTDLFRWPTVRALARNLGGEGGDGGVAAKIGSDRGARRRAMLSRRR